MQIQILATNDFHGRLTNNTNNEAGAAVLSGAVKQLRTANPNTAFVAAGDLIGASTFESFIQQDVPTIDALNEAGLDVSAVGNHELDQGFDDLKARVQGLADWEYIVANLRLKADNTHALAPTWTQELGGVMVGYVGAVTEDLPSLVSPAGIATLKVTDVVTEVNASAAALKADGADLIVLLVHEGAPNTDCATMDDNPASAFGSIVTGASVNIDAIVSGHTHLAYNCSIPVAAWSSRPVKERPVVSAGQYGTNLNKLVFTVDDATGVVSAKTQEIVALEGPDPDGSGPGVPPSLFPSDSAVASIVADAVAKAEVLGAAELGDVAKAFNRARYSGPDGDDDGTDRDIVENRGGESTLGNLVAEIQRWSTAPAEFGAAQIAFMNPGGLRANLTGPKVTYRQGANVQPFANTLVNMDLTGAQIKTVLEQQWQRDDEGAVPSRPFLRLGTSKGFEYSYDPARPEGSRITGIWLNGKALSRTTAYSVTVNSFLAAGGDNFREFSNGTNRRDTGQVDLEALVDYFKEFAGAGDPPLPLDASQRSVGATVTSSTIKLSSLAMTGSGDPVDAEVKVFDGARLLGTSPVVSALADTPFDEAGTASVPNTLPNDGRVHLLRVVGATTGTDIVVPVLTAKASANATVKVKPKKVVVDRTRAKVLVVVKAGSGAASGRVHVKVAGTTYKAKLKNGRAVVTLPKFGKPGKKAVVVKYLGNATTAADTARTTIRIVRG